MSMIYRKIGRKYVELREEFTGWPADGMFVVDGAHQYHVCDLQTLNSLKHVVTRKALEDALTVVCAELSGKSVSLIDIVTAITKEACK